MQGDGTSEDSATSAVRCRDSFVNCLAFLDCFSDAHSARGKARRPRLLPTPCPTRTHARARAHTHRTARLPARPRARTPARPHARTPAMGHLTSEAAERGGSPRSCWAPGRGAPKQVRVPADSPGPYTDRLRTTSRSLAEDRQERAARRLTRATSSSTRPNCSASRHDGVHGRNNIFLHLSHRRAPDTQHTDKIDISYLIYLSIQHTGEKVLRPLLLPVSCLRHGGRHPEVRRRGIASGGGAAILSPPAFNARTHDRFSAH